MPVGILVISIRVIGASVRRMPEIRMSVACRSILYPKLEHVAK